MAPNTSTLRFLRMRRRRSPRRGRAVGSLAYVDSPARGRGILRPCSPGTWASTRRPRACRQPLRHDETPTRNRDARPTARRPRRRPASHHSRARGGGPPDGIRLLRRPREGASAEHQGAGPCSWAGASRLWVQPEARYVAASECGAVRHGVRPWPLAIPRARYQACHARPAPLLRVSPRDARSLVWEGAPCKAPDEMDLLAAL